MRPAIRPGCSQPETPSVSARSSPTVRDAVDRVLATYASVHRGSGWTSRLTTHVYEQARAEVGRFVGARADDEVVFTRQTPTR